MATLHPAAPQAPAEATGRLLRPFEGVELAAERHAHACALQIGTQEWTYAELLAWSRRVAALLAENGGRAGAAACPLVCGGLVRSVPRIGVLASRSLTAYAGSLAVWASGAAVVALNPAHPPQRLAQVVQQAGIEVLLVGDEALGALQALLPLAPGVRRVVAPLSLLEPQPASGNDAQASTRVLRDARHLAQPAPWLPPTRPDDLDLAYLVFTSGSTGTPKGVAISHGNLSVYMRNMRALAPAWAEDRVATTFELSFDVALHDMLNAWWSGATLVVMPERAMLAPARFIIDQRISVWFSVASFAMLMHKQRVLRPGLFSHLRLSLLCGEALPLATATAWAEAAPNSELFNVWGPTETTMELSFYRWDRHQSPSHCRRGIVPIGIPFADHQHLLLDEQGVEVQGPGEGELLVCGPQVGPGYWNDEARTQAAFVSVPGREGRWYRSGDRAERDVMGTYHFVSRLDFMVKIRGHRIELGEIEHALRQASGSDWVAVLPLPGADGLPQSLVAFVALERDDGTLALQLRERLKPMLPKAWLPEEIRVLRQLPLNGNRKIDRGALAAQWHQMPMAASHGLAAAQSAEPLESAR